MAPIPTQNYSSRARPRFAAVWLIWGRAEMTCFRDQGPARCLVLALCVLRLVSASVRLCSGVVGGWGISLRSVSVSVGPWVCALACLCFVLSMLGCVCFPNLLSVSLSLSLSVSLSVYVFVLCLVPSLSLSLCSFVWATPRR